MEFATPGKASTLNSMKPGEFGIIQNQALPKNTLVFRASAKNDNNNDVALAVVFLRKNINDSRQGPFWVNAEKDFWGTEAVLCLSNASVYLATENAYFDEFDSSIFQTKGAIWQDKMGRFLFQAESMSSPGAKLTFHHKGSVSNDIPRGSISYKKWSVIRSIPILNRQEVIFEWGDNFSR